jgi:MFS family permease
MNRIAPVIASNESHAERAAMSDLYRYYVLAVLLLVGVASWADRQVFSIVLEAVKKDLHLSDTQLGLVGGTAFGLFYALVGLPLAWLADRVDRRKLIASAIALWSFATAMCALPTSFGALFLARMGVGIGEAGGASPSQSIVSDYFPPRRRGLAMGILYSYIPIGYLAAYWTGGLFSSHFGWRKTFVCFGIPGLLIALLVLTTIREPQRGFAEKASAIGPPSSIGAALKFFLSRRSLRHLPLAGAAHGIGAFGAAVWMPTFFVRVHGMPIGVVGRDLALIMGFAGLVGAIGGGYAADTLAKRTKNARWYVWVPGGMLVLSIGFTVLMYLTHSSKIALLLYIFPAIANHSVLGPITGTMQNLAGVRRRAMVAAFYLFLANLVAMGFGPLIIGAVSDLLGSAFGANALRYSLLFLIPTTCAWAATHLFLAGRTLRKDLESVDMHQLVG